MTVPEPAAHWLGGVERWNRAHGRASDALAAFAFAVVLGGLSISGAQGLHWSLVWVIVLIAAFAVLHLTVAFRRRWPEFAYAAASAALLVIVLTPDGQVPHPVSGGPARIPALFLPSSLVFLVALFSVAARASTARSRAALVIALAGVGIATGTTADSLHRYTTGGWLITFYVLAGLGLIVLMTWNLGRLALLREPVDGELGGSADGERRPGLGELGVDAGVADASDQVRQIGQPGLRHGDRRGFRAPARLAA